MGWLQKNMINHCHQEVLHSYSPVSLPDQYMFSQKRKRKWCEKSWQLIHDPFLLASMHAHGLPQVFYRCQTQPCIWQPELDVGLSEGLQRKEAWDAGIGIASWVKRLHSHTGGGVFLWCWLDWALQREQDGGMDGGGGIGTAQALSYDSHMHIFSLVVPWLPQPPPSSFFSDPCTLAMSCTVGWGILVALPPTTCTLNHIHSASNSLTLTLLHVTADC